MKKLSLLVATCLVFSAGAALAADPATDPFAELMVCRTMPDAEQKAACYDQAVDNLQTARKERKIIAVTAGEVAELERDAFGFSMPSLPKIILPKLGGSGIELKAVVLHVVEAHKRPNGMWRFVLDNGQVWIQTEKRKIYPPRKKPFDLQIKKGSLGSYLMQINGKGVWVRGNRKK
jgi:hypothetical protein